MFELITTKPKLTDKLLKQLPNAGINEMENGEVLGWIKWNKHGNFILIKHNESPFLLFKNYIKTNDPQYINDPRKMTCRKINEDIDPEKWWKAYDHCVLLAKTQIFY